MTPSLNEVHDAMPPEGATARQIIEATGLNRYTLYTRLRYGVRIGLFRQAPGHLWVPVPDAPRVRPILTQEDTMLAVQDGINTVADLAYDLALPPSRAAKRLRSCVRSGLLGEAGGVYSLTAEGARWIDWKYPPK